MHCAGSALLVHEPRPPHQVRPGSRGRRSEAQRVLLVPVLLSAGPPRGGDQLADQGRRLLPVRERPTRVLVRLLLLAALLERDDQGRGEEPQGADPALRHHQPNKVSKLSSVNTFV